MNEDTAYIEKKILELKLNIAYLSGKRDALLELVTPKEEKSGETITGMLTPVPNETKK